MTPNGPSESATDQAARLIEVERAQIGHEIHDGLLPLIFAASATITSMDTGSAASQETEEKLEQVSQWLNEALQVGRRLLTEIYPPELIGTQWVQAARDTIDRLVIDCESEIQWRINSDVHATTAPIALAAYRIVVEAVRNATRHGGARHVVIEDVRKANAIGVKIFDDGCGFDPSQVPQDRYGIRSMIGRAKLVGGSLRIESQPGGPTSVIFQTKC